ncbi:tRNA (guanosine(46)-N7)-methyltransferase TrmB [Candidatus Gillettellia adelgis]
MVKYIISPEFDQHKCTVHRIRSFVRRQGRFTKGQKQALKKHWPFMGLNYEDKPVNIATIFTQNAPIVLEIGFGMGSSLVTMAGNHAEKNFLGIEVYLPGIGACLAKAHAAKLSNLRLMYHDAVEVLQNMIPDSSLNIVQLFFPDPWHKARHNKRRIVQPYFVELIAQKLKVGGIFHMTTDWQPYAEYMLSVMSKVTEYQNLSSNSDYLPRPKMRPLTKFELRAQRLGHGVWDLMFKKKSLLRTIVITYINYDTY